MTLSQYLRICIVQVVPWYSIAVLLFFLVMLSVSKSQSSLKASHNKFASLARGAACLAVGSRIGYQQGSRYERERRDEDDQTKEVNSICVENSWKGARGNEDEWKLAPEKQSNTCSTSEDKRSLSLHICGLHSFTLSQPLHLRHSLFAFDLLSRSQSLFADSLSLSLSPEQWDKKWPALQSLTFSLPPQHLLSFLFLLLPILSPSVFPFSLSSTCLRNVSEQHKRTKAWQEEEEEEKEGYREKVDWGKGETERLRGAELRLNGSQWRAVLCHRVLTISITHVSELFIKRARSERARTHTRWVGLSLCYTARLIQWPFMHFSICHGNRQKACMWWGRRWISQRRTALYYNLCVCISHFQTGGIINSLCSGQAAFDRPPKQQ